MNGTRLYQAEILALVEQGHTSRNIAEQLGCSLRHVLKVRREQGCSSPTRQFDPEVWEKVAELTRNHLSAREIAEIVHRSERQVTRIRTLMDARVCQPAPLLTEDELARAKELLDDGACCAEVARTLGRSPGTITKHFPEYRWTPSQWMTHVHEVQRLRRRVAL